MRDLLCEQADKAEKDWAQRNALDAEVQSQHMSSPVPPTEIDPYAMPPYPLAAVEGAHFFV